jgi:segregation and condensation protein B
MKLSPQALETLAVIAYKQPVTAPEVNEIRGVDSGGVLGGLISRKLITTAGRKQVIGRPILYKTTKEFLLQFGLKDVNELPSIEEFEKMAGHMDAEDEERPLETTAGLPFERSDEDVEVVAAHESVDTGENAVEANAGEAGVAVSTPSPSEAETQTELADPASSSRTAEIVELDSHIAEETVLPADHEPELITAVHPSTTVGGE